MSGTVKFFCKCGKEIWQELDDGQKGMSIRHAEMVLICSDCLLEKLRKEG